MLQNLEKSIEYFQENRKQFNGKKIQFGEQKYFLDIAKVDKAIHKVNAILTTISAAVLYGEFVKESSVYE